MIHVCRVGATFELPQFVHRLFAGVTRGQTRIWDCAPPEQGAAHIAAIVTQEAQRAELRMALAEDEQAVSVLSSRHRPAGS